MTFDPGSFDVSRKTVPSVDTLEKYAGALDVPLYRLFYKGEKPPKHVTPAAADHEKNSSQGNGSVGESACTARRTG
jgi:transcriptional regulator with XRE-family HTH domain